MALTLWSCISDVSDWNFRIDCSDDLSSFTQFLQRNAGIVRNRSIIVCVG